MILIKIMAGIPDTKNLLDEVENDESTDDELLGAADDTVCTKV